MIKGKEEVFDSWLYAFNHGFFPRFFILAGGRHFGKKFMMRKFTEATGRVLLEPQDLKVGTVREFMKEAQALSAPTFFLFPDAEEMNVQSQNAILKFVEEPNTNAYILMTVNNVEGLLNTILSRARLQMMAPYPKEVLEKETTEPLLLDFCDSPGQINYWTSRMHILGLAKKVSETIERVNYGNLFKIPSHLHDISEAEDFCDALSYFFGKRPASLTDYRKCYAHQYIISEHKRMVQNKSLNKENAMIAMLLKLKEVTE